VTETPDRLLGLSREDFTAIQVALLQGVREAVQAAGGGPAAHILVLQHALANATLIEMKAGRMTLSEGRKVVSDHDRTYRKILTRTAAEDRRRRP